MVRRGRSLTVIGSLGDNPTWPGGNDPEAHVYCEDMDG